MLPRRHVPHRQESRHQFDSVPQILDPKVLIEAVLVIVVISDRYHDRWRAKRAFEGVGCNVWLEPQFTLQAEELPVLAPEGHSPSS